MIQITDEVLHTVQAKIGNAMSNIAESHTLGMLETCEQLAAFSDDGVATLDVLMKLKIKRCIDGRFDVRPDILYDYKKRVKDSLGWITVIDPNPDLPGMRNDSDAPNESDKSDKSEVVEPEIVDEPEMEGSPESAPDVPALPAAPKLLPEASEQNHLTVTREEFIARVTGLPKPNELMQNEMLRFFGEVADFYDFSTELVMQIMSDHLSLVNFIHKVKEELYSGGDHQQVSEPENESQEPPKKKRGRKPKNNSDEKAPVSSTETGHDGLDIPMSDNPIGENAGMPQNAPAASEEERCDESHPSGVRCCLKKGHPANHCMTPEDRKIADEWEKKNRGK